MSGHSVILWLQALGLFLAIYYVGGLIDAWTQRHWRRAYRLHWFTGDPL